MKINNKTSLLIRVPITGFYLISAAPYGADAVTGPSTNVEMTGKTLESNATKSCAGYIPRKIDGSPLQANSPSPILLYVRGKEKVTISGKTPNPVI